MVGSLAVRIPHSRRASFCTWDFWKREKQKKRLEIHGYKAISFDYKDGWQPMRVCKRKQKNNSKN